MKLIASLALLGLAAVPAQAAPTDERAAVQRYVRARAADAAGMLDAAAAGYASALEASPGDRLLAIRAYRQAMLAGNMPLALRAAAILERDRVLPPDGNLLFLSNALLRRDWTRAEAVVARIRQDNVFGFMLPIVDAWIAQGRRGGDPLALLSDGKGGPLGSAYAGEHRGLLMIARGDAADGIAAIRAQAANAGGFGLRLRIAAAAGLQKRDRSAALSLLQGDEPQIAAARRLLEKRAPLPGAVTTPAEGVAELFARVAIDMNRERPSPLALTIAQLSTYLAPGNSETWLVASEMLAAAGHEDAALAALARIGADDPFATNAEGSRLSLLVRQGQEQAALAEAEQRVTGPGADGNDWSRLGDLRVETGNHEGAAEAYARAVSFAERNPGDKRALWSALLQQGGALEQADRWPEARAALRRAVELAPDEAVVLNYLGYAQLERRENLGEAEQLIERASKLRPDDAAITDSLGWAYYIRGNLPKAVETLERAVAAEPGDPTMNDHLGDAYWGLGRRIDARQAWAAALVYAEEKDRTRIRAKLDRGLTLADATP